MYFIPDLLGDRPITLLDSCPETAPSYLSDLVTRSLDHLKVAWTGEPYFDVTPDQIRLQWWTSQGNRGHRDYALRDHAKARQAYDLLCDMLETDVARVVVLGHAAQNPFVMHGCRSAYEVARTERETTLRGLGFEDSRVSVVTTQRKEQEEKVTPLRIGALESFIEQEGHAPDDKIAEVQQQHV